MSRRNGKVVLMALTLLVVPFGAVVLLLYAARLLHVRRVGLLRVIGVAMVPQDVPEPRRGSAR